MVSGLPDRYEIIETLGEGGMAVVYRALDTALKKEVAIKILRAGSEAELVARFQREARALSRLKHRNVVGVLDFGVSEDCMPYLVMDFAAGRNLARVLDEEGPLPLERVASIMSQLCSGLAAAHRQAVVHRDLKPANVIVGEDGESITIVDFGLARFLEGSARSATLTRPGAVMGSPFYMSPEQASGEEADTRSDIYSLGCVLFKMLTGREPFRGETIVDTLLTKSKSPPPSLSSFVDREYPDGLDSVVAVCLALAPGDRFATVEELDAKLSEVFRGLETEGVEHEVEQEKREQRSFPDRAGRLSGPGISILVSGCLLFGLGSWIISSLPEQRTGLSLEEDKQGMNQDRKEDLGRIERVGGIWRGQMVEDRHLDELPDGDLEALELSESKVTSRGFDRLRNRGIKSLKIRESSRIDEQAALSIARLATLENLEFDMCNSLKDACLVPLSSLPRLRRLSLTNCIGVDDGIVRSLAAMPALESLDISGTSFAPASLPRLAAVKRLSTLSIARLNLKDEQMPLLLELPVETIVVSSNHALTGKGIGALAKNKSLRQIDLRHCENVGAGQLQALRKNFPRIKFVIESARENRFDRSELY